MKFYRQKELKKTTPKHIAKYAKQCIHDIPINVLIAS